MFGSAKKSDDHKHIVEMLARQSGASTDEVALLYEQEREALEARSRVKVFVPVLVTRRVRDLLRQHARNNTAETLAAA